MEAKDLMVNDWIYDGWDNKFKQVTIDMLVELSQLEEGKNYVQPVPVTPEFLSDNEFTVNYTRDTPNIETWTAVYEKKATKEDASYLKITIFLCTPKENRTKRIRCDIYYLPDDYNTNTGGSIGCCTEYVHQLQKALKVCGLDYFADDLIVWN